MSLPSICERPSCGLHFENDRDLNHHLQTVQRCGDWYDDHVVRWPQTDTADQGIGEFETLSHALSSYPTSAGLAETLFSTAPRIFDEPLPWTSPEIVEEQERKGRESAQDVDLFDEPPPESRLKYLEELLGVTDRAGSLSDDGEEGEDWMDSGGDGMEQIGLQHSRWSASTIVETDRNAGREYGEGRHTLKELDTVDMYRKERVECLYYPFRNEDDFELGAWLLESGVSMEDIDKFLKLPSVRSPFLSDERLILKVEQMVRSKITSFKTAQDLHIKAAMLPKPPAWISRIVTVDGGSTVEPIELLYRNSLQVFRYLFGHPIFSGHQRLAPRKAWADFKKEFQILDEPVSGSRISQIQVGSFIISQK